MFQKLLNFLDTPAPKPPGDLRMSVAILLLEAARQDDHFDAGEQAVIHRLLGEKFGLSDAECTQLIQSAEAATANMVQLHPHTSVVFEKTSPAERIQLMEMLWEVVYADGVLDPEEDLLVRRLGSLIYVTDRDRVLARQRVLERLGRKSQN